MLSPDMTEKMFANLSPQQRHDAWLAALSVGAIPPDTPDPLEEEEEEVPDADADDGPQVSDGPDSGDDDDYADPLDEDADDEPAPADDGGEPAVSGKGTPRVVRFRNRRPAGGEPATPHSFRIEDSLWKRAQRRADKRGYTMNYVTRALISAYARGRIRVGEAQPVVDVVPTERQRAAEAAREEQG